jgi:erythromycin esterase-like protein
VWTREHFGPRVFTIGQYEFEGEAVANSRRAYAIPRATAGSLEHRLHEWAKGVPSIVRLSGAQSSRPPWAMTAMPSRYNGQHEQRIVPANQYDALLFLPRVSPPRFLY